MPPLFDTPPYFRLNHRTVRQRMKIINPAHMNAAVLLSLLCAGAPPVSPSPQRRAAARDEVTVRAKGRRLIVREGGRSHALDVWDQIEAAKFGEAYALFLTRKGGLVYLLLRVCGPSKAKPDDHECGAGTECDLVWVKLDESWRKLDAKSVRYDSCWAPIMSDEGPKVSGRTVTLEYENLRDNTRHEVTYDADKPEEGLVDESESLPKEKP